MSEPKIADGAVPHSARRNREIVFLAEDAERRRDLLRKRALALGLLIGMALAYLLTFLAGPPGFWTMLARHGIEAGIAGGLADWFAVTALFRKPFGLPIPYTGLIEAQKDHVARTVGAFVERNFLVADLIAERVRTADPAAGAAAWLGRPENVQALDRHVRRLFSGFAASLDERSLGKAFGRLVEDELSKLDLSPVLGRMLQALLDSPEATELVDRALDALVDAVFANADLLYRAVEKERAWWTPRSFDRRITTAILKGLDEFVSELRMPDSASRLALRGSIQQMATNLVDSPALRAQVAAVRNRFMDDPTIQSWLTSSWRKLQAALMADEGQPTSSLQLASLLETIHLRLQENADLRRDLGDLSATLAGRAAGLLSGKIGSYISEVVISWDARTIADRIELTLGPNLQFIRINGTLVGFAVGCLLFLLSSLLS